MYLDYPVDDAMRVIIIHPNYNSQHLLLMKFIQDVNHVYVRFDDTDNEQAAWEQLNAAYDAASLQQDPDYWILEECDRIQPQILDKLIVDMLSEYEASTFVILSRMLPHVVVDDPSVRKTTQIIPVDKGLRLTNVIREYPIPHLEVHAFGQGRAYLNGKVITDWNGPLARRLFFYMIDNPIIRRDDIFETFWSDVKPQKAANAFHVTKRSIHELLGFNLIEFKGGHYHVTDDMVLTYDVADFHELSQNGQYDRDVDQLETAHQLFKGSFMQGVEDTVWSLSRREELNAQYAETMLTLVQLKFEAGKLGEALGIATRILAINPMREDIAVYIMGLYLKLNQPEDALKTYDTISNYLHGQGINPGSDLEEMKDLAESLI